ncbi:MAG: hypothetical protein NXI32_09330 [bacterium]|nr:hypothetical protein [bacterium]
MKAATGSSRWHQIQADAAKVETEEGIEIIAKKYNVTSETVRRVKDFDFERFDRVMAQCMVDLLNGRRDRAVDRMKLYDFRIERERLSYETLVSTVFAVPVAETLMREGYRNLGSLIPLSREDLLKFNQIGEHSSDKILKVVDRIRPKARKKAGVVDTIMEFSGR